jgi:hypothetical protein
MNEHDLTIAVVASCRRALQGVAMHGIRMISLEWEGMKRLLFRVHYDRQPTMDEVEEMEIVTTEIVADVPFDMVSAVEVVVSNEPADKLMALTHIVYLRPELPPVIS